MRRLLGWFFVGWMLVAGAGQAAAQQMDMISYSEYESLVRRLEQLEAQLASHGGDGACCDTGPQWTCRTPGIVAGGEIAWLKVFHSEGQAGDFAYQAAPRFWLGYQFEGGLGLRARYFEYDKQASSPDPNLYDGFHMVNFDVEVTDTFDLGKWSGLIAGGVRFTEYREENNAFAEFSALAGSNIGLVLGIEGYRPITDALYLFGLTRGSISVYENRAFEGGLVQNATDFSFFIWELQLGAEYRYPLCGTSYVFARAAAEAQVWSGISNTDSEDITLFGGLFSVGLAR